MQRRTFVRAAAALAGVAAAPAARALVAPGPLAAPRGSPAAAGPTPPAAQDTGAADAAPRRTGRFQLDYAPHFGMFRHHAGDDLLAQLRFMADEGFTSLEDNGMAGRDVDTQHAIAEELTRLGMRMGVFVAHADFARPTFATDEPAAIDALLVDMQRAVEVAGRVGARWCTVVPGTARRDMQPDYQTALVVENLRRCCEVLEPAGLTMVLEPLNAWSDHAGCFLVRMAQAYLLCRAVDSPSCKILDDLYHQQVSEGHLIRNLDASWGEIAYIQVGDNPGRKEPTTGEIAYRNVFRHLHAKGYDGIVGMEHGNSRAGKDGERAVIEAYARVDAF